MSNLDKTKALLATLRQALYQYDDHLAETVMHIETLLDGTHSVRNCDAALHKIEPPKSVETST